MARKIVEAELIITDGSVKEEVVIDDRKSQGSNIEYLYTHHVI